MVKKNSRDLVGYGSKGKKISWPNNAKLALQIVLNYEEGGENSILNGDKYSETFLSEIIGAKAIKTIKNIFGSRPLGWYTGRCSPNTRDLVFEDGGFLYDSDSYSDDLPYWEHRGKKKQLIIPYTLDNNDMRFATNQGFNTGDHFYNYLKDSFDALYEEGKTSPKMMSVGLHCRLIGRPGRIQSLKRFIDYVLKFNDIWICKRVDIAKHWIKNYS